MSAPSGAGQPFAPRDLPAEDAAAFVRSGTDARSSAQVVEALVEAPADDVRRRIGPWATVTDEGDRGCLIRMETHDLNWAALALGSVEAEFTVLGPPALRDLLAGWADRFARSAERYAPRRPARAARSRA